MLIRMKHPDHGFTHAHDHAEIKRLEELGWEKHSDQDFKALLAAKAEKRGPGRPRKSEADA